VTSKLEQQLTNTYPNSMTSRKITSRSLDRPKGYRTASWVNKQA